MGLDLRVYIDKYHGKMNEWFIGSESLSFHRDYGLFDIISNFPAQPITDEKIKFQEYNEDGIHVRNTDPYGEPLTFVRAEAFKEIDYVPNQWNNSILLFLKSLPSDTIVILYWE